eukprot:18326-Heterococcus_DN1.PRE.3
MHSNSIAVLMQALTLTKSATARKPSSSGAAGATTAGSYTGVIAYRIILSDLISNGWRLTIALLRSVYLKIGTDGPSTAISLQGVINVFFVTNTNEMKMCDIKHAIAS